MIIMTRSTAGFVQHEFWWFSSFFRFRWSVLEGEKQGDSEISEHWLYCESSVRVRRKPLVKSRIAMAWSNRIPKKTRNAHRHPTQFSTILRWVLRVAIQFWIKKYAINWRGMYAESGNLKGSRKNGWRTRMFFKDGEHFLEGRERRRRIIFRKHKFPLKVGKNNSGIYKDKL